MTWKGGGFPQIGPGGADCHPQRADLPRVMNGALGGTAFIKMPQSLASLPRKKTPACGCRRSGDAGRRVGMPIQGHGWAVGMECDRKMPLRQWFPEKDPPLLISAGTW